MAALLDNRVLIPMRTSDGRTVYSLAEPKKATTHHDPVEPDDDCKMPTRARDPDPDDDHDLPDDRKDASSYKNRTVTPKHLSTDFVAKTVVR